ncbi:MAG: hypothetical protein E5V91_25955 [Mesorhizobium sp.]|uniref:hypothetical protein n=2 Tax=Mesorhizobium TaxID=68287 RepID=UPI000FCAE39B|nr:MULTISPECIES: hypothetical protein [unclassified Mesorhizobium]RUW41025.1 hypothetical protein EOA37_12275 [Mesorhizobium sp. M2A.F.Ca.ET.015.02.1.1]RUW65785.1 hypothetical protein EOA28_32205 [Mesorhizobium sp. M2A.F.Ca.ET.067.02.1.1]RVC94520.1 hypothetical protein EN739_16845 [Mesorhizobium sp. M2A.F.Ca.ET.017.03.2.1]RVC99176.1 hypothetical protein EN753_26730 [Mesorhizobium sp. M2A.F.Ca.ET.029.05.1.1]RWB38355.1 MAG: hypothetical protein EOQ46_29305 [Mesorhizobium sp.]
MLRQISEDVRANLKDRLRELRDAIRQSRHDSAGEMSHDIVGNLPPFPGRSLLGHAATAVDDALTIAESFVPHSRPLKVDGTTVKSLRSYFPDGDEDRQIGGERQFRRDMYYLTRAVLAGYGVDNPRVHEASFSAVHAAMRKRHADLLAGATADAASTDQVAAACAALLVECLNHRPVQPGEAATADRSLDIRCLAPVVLACGLATKADGGTPEPDILEIAVLAAEVREDRIRQACAQANAVQELTPVLATLLAHLT